MHRATRLLLAVALLAGMRVCSAQTPDTAGVEEADVDRILDELSDRLGESSAGAEQFAELLSDSHANDDDAGFRMEVIQRITRRLDTGRGYESDTTRTTYLGGPARLYTRIKASHGKRFEILLAAEKDPGEPLTWSPPERWYGVDHLAGSLAVRDVGWIRTLVLGDFVATVGQGLAMSHGLSPGVGRNVITGVLRSSGGVRPYGSAEENRFLRGAALTLEPTRGLQFTGLASRRTVDATIDPDAGVVEALGTTGLHRTDSERIRRDNLRAELVGAGLSIARSSFALGTFGYVGRFDNPVLDYEGPYVGAISLNANATIDRHAIAVDLAWDRAGSTALFASFSTSAGRSVRALLSVRRYPEAFESAHGTAFGQSGEPKNETGIYLGVEVRPTPRLTISAYADAYQFPWIRFGVPMPSSGYEALAAIEHEPREWTSWYVQFRTKTRGAGYRFLRQDGAELDAMHDETKQSLRWNLQHEFTSELTVSTRVEGTRYFASTHASSAASSFGFLLYQDVRFTRGRLRLDIRLTFFDTDDFDSRVFSYEPDLRHAFSSPAYSGTGRRATALITCRAGAFVVQLKYGVTQYEHVETVGSGLDEVQGSRIRELRAQVVVRL